VRVESANEEHTRRDQQNAADLRRGCRIAENGNAGDEDEDGRCPTGDRVHERQLRAAVRGGQEDEVRQLQQ
jgi:hypothetical protein